MISSTLLIIVTIIQVAVIALVLILYFRNIKRIQTEHDEDQQ